MIGRWWDGAGLEESQIVASVGDDHQDRALEYQPLRQDEIGLGHIINSTESDLGFEDVGVLGILPDDIDLILALLGWDGVEGE